jgi:hypothetical protein
MTTTTPTTPAPAAPLTLFQQIEADVQAFITKVVNEVEILISDAESALSNVAAMAPTIAADVTSAATFIEGIPVVGQNPDVMAAVSAVQVADAGLQAFAKQYQAATAPGGSITVSQATAAVVAGYQAVKAAQAATATLTSTAVATAPATAAVLAATPTS